MTLLPVPIKDFPDEVLQNLLSQHIARNGEVYNIIHLGYDIKKDIYSFFHIDEVVQELKRRTNE